MAEYVTREDIVSVGATQLTDLYGDGDPGEIQAPTAHIGQIIYAGVARLDAEASTLVAGVRLQGDAVTGDPVLALGAYGCGGAGTGTSATVSQVAQAFPVDIPVKPGANLRIMGLVAGTAGDDVAMSVTLRFDSEGYRGTQYVTREDLLTIADTQLTDEFDDADPPVHLVHDAQKIVGIIAAADIQEAAADDVAYAALQFRGGAVAGQPTIGVAAGGIGAINTGVGQETATHALVLPVDIPVKRGLPLQLYGNLAGEAGTNGNMVATAVLR